MDAAGEFIERHKDSNFRHKETLFSALSSGACALHAGDEYDRGLLTCKHYLDIYRRRLSHLQRFTTPHAQSLKEDTAVLCEGLAVAQDETCRLWVFEMPPHHSFAVFEGAQTGRVLGCIFAADKRNMSSDDWEKLWHGDAA
jgi:hypothetical protein